MNDSNTKDIGSIAWFRQLSDKELSDIAMQESARVRGDDGDNETNSNLLVALALRVKGQLT
tara:strand:- start:25 stop:207 length:183 start_codon:yes stop_codon:yes gene_type:complete